MGLELHTIPMLQDNYCWLLVEPATGECAIIDPAEAAPAEEYLALHRLTPRLILLTHHHNDHIGGAEALRRRFHCPIFGAAADQHRLPSLDRALTEGDTVEFAGSEGRVIEVPGHTIGHIAFYFPAEAALFCGDTLFSLGCGRLFEGTAEQMFGSLAKLKALPPETRICCGHEYTASNGRFALAEDPHNAALIARMDEVTRLRLQGLPTLPARLGEDCAANPFLRASDAAALGQLRARKDQFRG